MTVEIQQVRPPQDQEYCEMTNQFVVSFGERRFIFDRDPCSQSFELVAVRKRKSGPQSKGNAGTTEETMSGTFARDEEYTTTAGIPETVREALLSYVDEQQSNGLSRDMISFEVTLRGH